MWAMASFLSGPLGRFTEFVGEGCNSLHVPMYGSLRSAIVALDLI